MKIATVTVSLVLAFGGLAAAQPATTSPVPASAPSPEPARSVRGLAPLASSRSAGLALAGQF